MNVELASLRSKINVIDDEILSLLTTRASLLSDVLKVKLNSLSNDQINIVDPKREAAILKRLVKQNTSELPGAAIVSIFKTIISACRNLQLNQRDNG